MFALLRRLLPLAIVVNTAVFITACGTSRDGSSNEAGGEGASFRVALVTPGPVSDQAWNAGAYNGLLRIRDSLGATISNVETENPSVIEESFRNYGAQGYQLVLGHGFEFQDIAERVGRDFPKTTYVVTSGNRAAGNFASVEFAFEEGSYVAGLVAGALTTSNVIGAIGGTELPPVARSFAAYAAGAQHINPRVRVLTAYIGNWNDASAGKEHALAQIARGADVIFGNADAAGLGIFQAARESRTVRVIGANSDQAHVAPEVVIGSVVIDLPQAFLTVAREVRGGAFTSRVIAFDTADGVIRWTYNPALEATVPAAARGRIEATIAQMRAGTFARDSGRAGAQ